MSNRFLIGLLLISAVLVSNQAFAEVTSVSLDQTVTTTTAPAAVPSFVKPDPIQVQKALAQAGYYKGKVDGIVGKRTRAAIRAFQTANGLKVDGRVGPMTWEKLDDYLPNETSAESISTTEGVDSGVISTGIGNTVPLDPQETSSESGVSQELKQKLVS